MSFEFDFRLDHVKALLPGNKHQEDWYIALCEELPKYNITTPERVAAFIAQTGHESGGYTAMTENLNYKAEALSKIWPKRFPPNIAGQYARNPEKIANRAYCDRMGNGPEASGDGWKFHGRGLIQLTGRENYTKFAKEMEMDIDECIEYCETYEGAIGSACWFWVHHGLNELADSGDLVTMTKRINGGTLGLDDRTARYNKAIELFSS